MSASDLDVLAGQLSAIASTLRDLGAAAPPPSVAIPDPAATVSRETMLLDRARRLTRMREQRRECFAEVVALMMEPGFDVLLKVYVGALEGAPVTVSAARTAAGAPESVGERLIAALEQAELVVRVFDHDAAQMLLSLAPRGETMMARYLKGLVM